MLHVQLPYKKHIQWLCRGTTLDVGCGIGRHLSVLDPSSVGVEHNRYCVDYLTKRGYQAFTPTDFAAFVASTGFCADNLLLAHVLEHLTDDEIQHLFKMYMPSIKAMGTIVIITPQRAGFKSDPTHKNFINFNKIKHIATKIGCGVRSQYSFPFPRLAGICFSHNEFISILSKVDTQ